jgi:hypothetical protein
MTPAERVATLLAEYLGPHTAQAAVRTFARSALGLAPEAVRPEDVPGLLDALRPMLRTLLGSAICEELLAPLAKEFP